jgi:hypothetical protein
MLSDLDETIRQVLIKEGDFDPSEVDVSFDIPNREWSAGISKPTLNCYLFDIHERRLLREDGWRVENRGGREAVRRQPPLYFEMTYLITAWTRAVEDEHRLLWHVLRTLARFPMLKESKAEQPDDLSNERLRDCLSGDLRRYPGQINTTVAQLEGVLKSPGEFWTALENHLKPSLSYVVMLALDREAIPAGPPVLTTGIHVRLPEAIADDGFRLDRIFRIEHDARLGGVVVEVEGQDRRTTTDDQGWFRFEDLVPGRYVLLARMGDRTHRREVVIRDLATSQRITHFSDIILGQDGQPISGVAIEIEGLHLRTVTDAQGSFAFDLTPGRYTLLIHMDDWTQRREIAVRDPGYTMKMYLGGAASAGVKS